MAMNRGIEFPHARSAGVKALVKYWRSIHPAVGLPGRQHFNPIDIRPLLPNVWLLDVHRKPLRFRFRVIGTSITSFAGRDSTGDWLDELYDSFETGPGYELLQQAVEKRRPAWQHSKSMSRPDKTWVVLEKVYLPLAADGEQVDMVLGLTDILKAP